MSKTKEDYQVDLESVLDEADGKKTSEGKIVKSKERSVEISKSVKQVLAETLSSDKLLKAIKEGKSDSEKSLIIEMSIAEDVAKIDAMSNLVASIVETDPALIPLFVGISEKKIRASKSYIDLVVAKLTLELQRSGADKERMKETMSIEIASKVMECVKESITESGLEGAVKEKFLTVLGQKLDAVKVGIKG